jgi:hypothetical protein
MLQTHMLGGIHTEEIFRKAAALVDMIVKIMRADSRENDKRTGCYLMIYDQIGHSPVVNWRIGLFENSGDANEYYDFAGEKARRLDTHPEHELSYESHDHAQGMYGGALKIPSHHLILSASGLQEKWNQAMVLVLSYVELKWRTLDDVTRLAHLGECWTEFNALLNLAMNPEVAGLILGFT